MKITVTHDDGTTRDITELVQIAYDVATNSMDWGSGFLDQEETNGLILLSEACRFPDCEQTIAEVWRDRLSNMPTPGSTSKFGPSCHELSARAKERGVDYWHQVEPTPEERAAFLAEIKRTTATAEEPTNAEAPVVSVCRWHDQPCTDPPNALCIVDCHRAGGPVASAPNTIRVPVGLTPIPCITQSPAEPVSQSYRDVCMGNADLLATSVHCEGTGCGGHPICRPCYDIARADGLVL